MARETEPDQVVPTGAGSSGPVAVRPLGPEDLVARACAQWRAALVTEAGDSALADVGRLGGAVLDITAAHPSGIAQLFAGRTTRLSNLVREGSALTAARRRARAVSGRADEHAQRYGIASTFLAIGVATWVEELPDEEPAEPAGSAAAPSAAQAPAPASDDAAADAAPGEPAARSAVLVAGTPPAVRVTEPDATTAPIPLVTPALAAQAAARTSGRPAARGGRRRTRTLHAPVLLRPVTVAPHPGEPDIDLGLEPSLEVNPLLAVALRARGALLDPVALARDAFGTSGFDPRPALDRLRGLGETLLEGFDLDDRLLVGTFVHPEQSLVDDLDDLAPLLTEHEVVAALAGDERSATALAHPLPPRPSGDRTPDEEGVGDLDPAQLHVLEALGAGHHLLVDAPPGSDVAGTVAAVVADATAAGRTVLYVAGHRRAAEAVTERLRTLGLDDVVLDVAPRSGWREQAGQRLLAAMTAEPVTVDGEKVAIVERELLDRRSRLQRYIAGLHRVRAPWDCSAYDALQALARLTSTRPAPQTRVRLTAPVAEALGGENRAQAGTDLVRVASLGAFSPAAHGSPWYGADLPTPDRARAALRRIDHLLDHALPQLRAESGRVAEETGLVPAPTPAAWTEQLAMLEGVRAALDVFRPIVFERSAADLVAATATAEWRAARGIEMSGAVRRRLRKQAKDMLRPGRPVADLHGALLQAAEQREIWRAHCPAGGWPRIPQGLATIELDSREARADLDALSAVLEPTAGGGALDTLTWDELELRLGRLRADRETLDTLPERTALLRSLAQRGLGALLDDLAARRVQAGVVAAELDLAWWSTVFERILAEDPALAGQDGVTLARLVAEFRALDERLLADRAVLARASARSAVLATMAAAESETQELFGEVVEGRFGTLRQAVERYPRVARHLRPCIVASPMMVPHLLPPVRDVDVVIVDAAGHLPLEEVVPALARGRQVLVIGDSRCPADSALAALAPLLPTIALRADAARRDPALTAFLSTHGYGDRLRPTPLPSDAGLLRLEVVDGSGMPDDQGSVEGTAAEVERVVALVAEHARTRPGASLAVVSASRTHADRVRDAVAARAAEDPAVARLVAPERPEPFTVVQVGATQGLLRDDVVLSIGFGRTPHGRVLHRFGPLTEDGGDAALVDALTAVRERLTVVSCFAAGDLDADRLKAPGAVLLADLLALAERRSAGAGGGRPAPHAGPDPDRLVLDLAERLWRAGLLVDVDHGLRDGYRIPLVVGHPDVPDRMLVAVLTDDDAYVAEPSVRVRDRQVPQRLERLGWTVAQVWSAAAFLDPQAEADAVCAAVIEARHALAQEQAAAAAEVARAAEAARVSAATSPRPGPRASSPAPSAVVLDDGDTAEVGLPVAVPLVERVEPVADAIEAGAEAIEAGAEPVAPAVEPVEPVVEQPGLFEVAPARGPRPDIEAGLPIGTYTDDQLDDLAAWIVSDGVPRGDVELATALRAELGVTRRGSRVDRAVDAAIRRLR